MNRTWYLEWSLKSFFIYLFFLLTNLVLYTINPYNNPDSYTWLSEWLIGTPWLIHVITIIPLAFSIAFLVKGKSK